MPDDPPNQRTADELLQILLNKAVVKEGEYDCTLKSNRDYCTIRFERSQRDHGDKDDEPKNSGPER